MAVLGQSLELVSKLDYVMRSQPSINEYPIKYTELIEYLINDNLLNAPLVEQASHSASKKNIPLIHFLVQSKYLSNDQILNCCKRHLNLLADDLINYDFSQLQTTLVNVELMKRYYVLPLKYEQNLLYLGIADPTDNATITAINFHVGLAIQPLLVAATDIEKIINTYCQPHIVDIQLETALSKINNDNEELNDDHTQVSGPIVELVNRLIQDAIENKISDIHIEPYEHFCRIRFRRDGLLYEAANLASHLATSIAMRLKIMAKLNIAERRLPQDGHIQLQTESKISIRMSTCPTLFGEKIVLRILYSNTAYIDINSLGFTELQKKLFVEKISQPQGLILVTGPTGSGKTMTLYSALHYLNKIEKNISSVEDPIEIELTGINQVNVNPKIGFNFATALRTFLRQDPEIIMIGEIRDVETATIAMQAAQTGHLVLSTLHTNSAAETIHRLHSIGVSTHNMITSISLIIAQRLVRKLCSDCKILETTYQAVGCKNCHQGHNGRIGIFELIPMTEELAHLLLTDANSLTIQNHIKSNQWMQLTEAALEKINKGIISEEEMLRVLTL